MDSYYQTRKVFVFKTHKSEDNRNYAYASYTLTGMFPGVLP